MTTCPSNVGLTNPASQEFALSMVILFPLFMIFCVAVFYLNRGSTVFLRKRSLKWLAVGFVGAIIPYGCFAVYDYVGPSRFPCALYICFVYASNPAVSYPLVGKIADYNNAVAYWRLRTQLQRSRESLAPTAASPVALIGDDPLQGKLSVRTLAAHLRVAFCFSRSQEDKILNAKFSRTAGFMILWFFLTALPFLLVFIIRLGMNPHWMQCTGCEIETFDAAFLVGIAIFALLLSCSANPTFSKKVSKRDTLRIVRECMWSWQVGGLFYNLGFILFLIDPGGVYAKGIFDWKWFVLFATAVLFYIQTIHQVAIARRLKYQVVIAATLDPQEKLREVMADKALRGKLEAYMQGELSIEVVKFLVFVDAFRANYAKDGAEARAADIVKNFIKSGAQYEVNISASIRSKILATKFAKGDAEQGVKGVEVSVFDQAYDEVKREFLNDGFARFLKRLALDQDNSKPSQVKTVVASAASQSEL